MDEATFDTRFGGDSTWPAVRTCVSSGGWQLRWVDNKGNASQCSGGVVFSLSAPPLLFVTSLLRYEFGGIGMIGGGEGFCDGFDYGQ